MINIFAKKSKNSASVISVEKQFSGFPLETICLMGLSGSGKTCYLYSMSYILSQGLRFCGHDVKICATNTQQALKLHKGIETMLKGDWPYGSSKTQSYPFQLLIDGAVVREFIIYDYRGGALNGVMDRDQGERIALYEYFEKSGCLVFLLDGETLLQSLDAEKLSSSHKKMYDRVKQVSARNSISYLETLLYQYEENRNAPMPPVLITITKSDVFENNELEEAKSFLMSTLHSLFSSRSKGVVGITTIQLGKNIKTSDNKLNGNNLCLDTSGNFHIPILYALMNQFDEEAAKSNFIMSERDAKGMLQTIFPDNRIQFYCQGKRAYFV